MPKNNSCIHKISIGIDPGSRHLGWAIIIGNSETMTLTDHGIINVPTKYKLVGARLEYIRERLDALLELEKSKLDKFDELFVNIEDYYIHFGAGAKVIPWVQGLILWLSSGKHKINSYFIPPQTVKKLATGNGRAEKKQIQSIMVEKFKLPNDLFPDEYDAIAIAYAGILNIKKKKVM